ncbi:MAG TPA: YceI family protein [Deltaproteobacteria bacterium]|nr:YceI family protein [Deltaproteobacteria bacterium]
MKRKARAPTPWWRAAGAWLAAALVALAAGWPAAAEEQILALDPAATKIAFTLGATLHTVDGSVRLSRGEVRFDPAGGAASGEIVLDARSAQTGNASRDANMHRDVLESERFPTIVFRAGELEVLSRDETSAQVRLRGTLELHGQSLPFELPATLAAHGDRLGIAATFRVPYVDWGMRDPSRFLVRVDRFVDIAVSAEGRLEGR